MASATLCLLLGACTIEDASDKRAADSAAAASATGAAQTTPPTGTAGGQTAPAAGQQPSTTATPTNAAPTSAAPTSAGDSSTAGASPAPGTDSAGAAGTATATGAPSGGNLSPDSVDVGRRRRADALPLSSARLEVDLGAKQLYLYDDDRRVASYRIAVGSTQWPTQAGEWNVFQVVWNPEWIPPDESWAEQRTPKKPGAPDNPLGRAQLVYDPPRTIHGTNDPTSIGKAVSHGSIRMANADVVRLARQLMEITGVKKDAGWYRQVQQNTAQKVVVDLPKRVPIKIS